MSGQCLVLFQISISVNHAIESFKLYLNSSVESLICIPLQFVLDLYALLNTMR